MQLSYFIRNTLFLFNTDSTITTQTHTQESSVDGTLYNTKPSSTSSLHTSPAPPLTTTEAVLARRVYALSVLLEGVTILRKGEVDIIASSCGTISKSCSGSGSGESTGSGTAAGMCMFVCITIIPIFINNGAI